MLKDFVEHLIAEISAIIDSREMLAQSDVHLIALIVVLTVVSLTALTTILQILSLMKNGRSITQVRQYTMKVAEENEENKGVVRIHIDRMRELGLKSGRETVVESIGDSLWNLFGGRRLAKQKQALIVLRYRTAGNVEENQIELPPSLIHRLFPRQNIGDGDSVSIRFATYEWRGLNSYWNNPNPNTRFANRFAVGFSVFMTFVPITIGFLLQQLIWSQ
ncbi:MAG: hypothetical protein EP340_09205 [Alphaproteobacteria bacterium]|nr:MAG: hypothetical protein EP340_09205 [Alphaproteobacteria bacterium]